MSELCSDSLCAGGIGYNFLYWIGIGVVMLSLLLAAFFMSRRRIKEKEQKQRLHEMHLNTMLTHDEPPEFDEQGNPIAQFVTISLEK